MTERSGVRVREHVAMPFLEISGTRAALGSLGAHLRAERGTLDLTRDEDPTPYDHALAQLEHARTEDLLLVTVSPDHRALRVTGSRPALDFLADELVEFARDATDDYTVQFEHLPDDPYIHPGTIPFLIRFR
ncbi:Imm32 family immunity protein [Actinokineospora diospyrosa]|uniref:Uncharacterized protein n=1 Tax=Actinokineospora diospyrosa TaxID=103728 RepID=A0ABT1I5I3_9PSEU|nr:hypothetical protein [Actinokineospora diospyrosa]MCP2267885.1 hypothetical protein [Actinokineospora diospyrosa]